MIGGPELLNVLKKTSKDNIASHRLLMLFIFSSCLLSSSLNSSMNRNEHTTKNDVQPKLVAAFVTLKCSNTRFYLQKKKKKMLLATEATSTTLITDKLSIDTHTQQRMSSKTCSVFIPLSLQSISRSFFSPLFLALFAPALFYCSFYSTGKYLTNYHSIKMSGITFSGPSFHYTQKRNVVK